MRELAQPFQVLDPSPERTHSERFLNGETAGTAQSRDTVALGVAAQNLSSVNNRLTPAF